MRVNGYIQATGAAGLVDIADRLRVPPEVLEPSFTRLVETGYAVRTGDQFWPTSRGLRQVDFISSLIVARIMQQLARANEFQSPLDRVEVEEALARVVQRMLVQRTWGDDDERTAALLAEK